MPKRVTAVGFFVLVALWLQIAPLAGAAAPRGRADAAQRTDPGAASPAGVIYQIPFDNGRSDAAPVPPVGGSPGGGPRSPAGGAGAGIAGATAAARAAAPLPPGVSATSPSSIHSENGFGSSSAVPGVVAGGDRSGAGALTSRSPGSNAPTYLLLLIIAVVAITVGLATARAARSRRRAS